MTTAPPMRPDAIARPPRGTGGRHQRRLERRRVERQQVLVVLVMLLALAITVAVLGQQWLASGLTGSPPGSVTGPTGLAASTQ